MGKHHNEYEDDNDSDDNDSEFSDIDYELSDKQVSHLKKFGISENRMNELWNKQSGLCYISNYPMVFDGDLYKVEVAPRRISQKIGDDNSILVCKSINRMRDAVNLTWTQFKALINQMANNSD